MKKKFEKPFISLFDVQEEDILTSSPIIETNDPGSSTPVSGNAGLVIRHRMRETDDDSEQ